MKEREGSREALNMKPGVGVGTEVANGRAFRSLVSGYRPCLLGALLTRLARVAGGSRSLGPLAVVVCAVAASSASLAPVMPIMVVPGLP
eukprot:1274502-Pyramimonas_sp.AAC.1